MWSLAVLFQNDFSPAVVERIGERLCPYGRKALAFELSGGVSCVVNADLVSRMDDIDEDERGALILVGEVQNLAALREWLLAEDAFAGTESSARVVRSAIERLGPGCASYLEGAFAIVSYERASGMVRVFSSPTSQLPLFHVEGEQPILTSEVKSVVGVVPLRLKPFSALPLSQDLPSDFTIFQNVRRLAPGTWAEFSSTGRLHGLPGTAEQLREGVSNWSSRQSAAVFGDALESNVRDCVENANGRTLLGCLSAGLDSALVLSLARRTRPDAQAVSIGSPSCNEFEGAAETARLLDVHHERLLVDPSQWIEGVLDAVHYGEIFDGLSAEIQAPLACLYRALSGRQAILLSGYGADLLSGGMFDPGVDLTELNARSAASIRRTLWTLEFAPFLALRHGIFIKHPFWTRRLIRVALHVPASVKVAERQVKKFLRDWAIERGVLPEVVARRPKIGVHEGSGVDAHFASFVGAPTRKSYEQKNAFVYRAFDQLFVRGVPRSELEPAKLLG